MTTPHPTRREADAWWESLPSSERHRIAIRERGSSLYPHEWRRWNGGHTATYVNRWWKERLPDQRAVTIYQQENRG